MGGIEMDLPLDKAQRVLSWDQMHPIEKPSVQSSMIFVGTEDQAIKNYRIDGSAILKSGKNQTASAVNHCRGCTNLYRGITNSDLIQSNLPILPVAEVNTY